MKKNKVKSASPTKDTYVSSSGENPAKLTEEWMNQKLYN